MGSLGQPATEQELDNRIREVDGNSDGCISLQEFIELNTKGVDSNTERLNLQRPGFVVVAGAGGLEREGGGGGSLGGSGKCGGRCGASRAVGVVEGTPKRRRRKRGVYGASHMVLEYR